MTMNPSHSRNFPSELDHLLAHPLALFPSFFMSEQDGKELKPLEFADALHGTGRPEIDQPIVVDHQQLWNDIVRQLANNSVNDIVE